ncbi:MAG: methyltransferase domain-containing protein [Verrucomicrobia bacterium]|nr:methyltransferase domain-containing protein [Verrucomicrobiota bacterium]
MTTKAVLFDIDGTLIRTGGAGTRAFAQTSELVYGIPRGTDGMKFHGRTDTSLVHEFFQKHGLPSGSSEVQRFLDAYLEFLRDELRRCAGQPCPGIAQALDGLRTLPEPPLVGLLTGNIRAGAALKLEAHGLNGQFELGVFGDEHPIRNELAVLALDKLRRRFGSNLEGREIVVVGDTRADIECAHHIGARCVAVATGGETLAELLAHSPEWAVESLEGCSAARMAAAGTHWEKETDWESLYQAGDTRWDKGAPAPGLIDFLKDHATSFRPDQRVAVPGCGRGHDARAWAEAGFHATGFDLAPSAVREASRTHRSERLEFVQADFLSTPPPAKFDWLFEHTLFCAIPPARRTAYAQSVRAWLEPGGHFLAIHYLQPEDEAGPPHAATVKEVLARFSPDFELIRHWVPRSFEGREGRERCFLWRKL